MHFQTVEHLEPILEANAATRASLIARVREWSDDESWQEFFELYWKLIYSLAVHAGLNECEAEEVVQATMISISKGIKDFKYERGPGSFRKWICRQAWWKINDQLRRRRRDQRHRHVSDGQPAEAADRTATAAKVPDARNSFDAFVEEDWHRAVHRIALERVRASVKSKHFQIFDLHVIKQWPIRDVARLLQVSPAQVYLIKSRLARLLKKTVKQVAAQLENPPKKTAHK